MSEGFTLPGLPVRVSPPYGDHKTGPVQLTPAFDFEFLQAAAVAFNERNDCSVKAVCLVTDRPYPEIHEMFRKLGRRKRCGTPWHITTGVLVNCGYRLQDVTVSFPLRTIRAVGPSLDRANKYFVRASKHVAAAVGGRVYDWSEDRGLYVKQVFRLVGQADEDPVISFPNTDRQAGRWSSGVSASGLIWAMAEKELEHTLREMDGEALHSNDNDLKPPPTRRFWLALRARVMARAESYHIKRTTASVELGKWQESKGYPMGKML